MISSSIKEGNNPHLTENHSSSSNDKLFDFFNIYPSDSCIECLESCFCLHNYKIVSNENSNDSSNQINNLFPLFSTSDQTLKANLSNEEWYLKLSYLKTYF